MQARVGGLGLRLCAGLTAGQHLAAAAGRHFLQLPPAASICPTCRQDGTSSATSSSSVSGGGSGSILSSSSLFCARGLHSSSAAVADARPPQDVLQQQQHQGQAQQQWPPTGDQGPQGQAQHQWPPAGDQGAQGGAGSQRAGGGEGEAPLSKAAIMGKLSQDELWMSAVNGRCKIWSARQYPHLKVGCAEGGRSGHLAGVSA